MWRNNRPFLGHNRSQTLAPKLREIHVPLESVWERLVRAVEEGSKRPSKCLKGFKLRRTSNLTFSKTDLKLHTEKQRLRLSLRTVWYATNTHKKYFYTFRINQITFTYGERKKERPNFYWMFSQNLPISSVFTAILKNEATTMQRNRSVRTAWLTIKALYQSYSTGNELIIMMLNIGMLLKWYTL